MAEVILEQRVTNLEEMMADLIRENRLSQERIEADLAAYQRENRLSQERREADLAAYRERREADMAAYREENRLSQERREADLAAYRERREADLAAYREEHRLSQQKREADLVAYQERREADLATYQAERQADARQWNRQYGELANKMGTMVEDLVAPSLPRILGEVIACPEDESISMAVRVRRSLPGQRGVMQEFDAVASCGEYALFNETKSSLAAADIDNLIDKLSTTRDYFPEYQHHRHIGVVATLYIDPSVVRYATRQGILALALGDDLMDMVNGPEFQLREF